MPHHPLSLPTESELSAIRFDPDNLDGLTRDPDTAMRVRDLQRRAMASLEQNIAALLAELETVEPLPPANRNIAATNNVRALSTSARQASAATIDRRKMAHDVLVSAILNRNNPDWVMTDPATYKVDRHDLLGTLIRLPPL
ncbi:ribonuclease D [Actimicrobium sp. GrIS 1.19]|uniref:hypothetical protein n=1 Tax=Actimicrobium sp. GrIS 1.19 TaxID=3071708 RepID=UPI002E0867B8|nr:ribonuclease D [Actimicrobium sp. GrIS 1.19]